MGRLASAARFRAIVVMAIAVAVGGSACGAEAVPSPTKQNGAAPPPTLPPASAGAEPFPVWHPLRSGCFREVLMQSAADWTKATPAHEGATSTSSLRFWRHREGHAEVIVIDSGGSPRLSSEQTPFIIVASGAWARTCVERLAPIDCPEAEALRRQILDHRVRIGEDVAEDGRMALFLHATSFSVEVVDQYATRNRWSFLPEHADYPLWEERFASVDRCFAKVRSAMEQWASLPEAPPPTL